MKLIIILLLIIFVPIIINNNIYAIEEDSSCPISLYQMRTQAALNALLEDQDIDEGIYQLTLLQESLERC